MFISQSYASVELKYENSKLFTQFNFYYDLLGYFFADFFRSPRRRSKTPDSGEKLKKNVHFQDEEKTDQSAPRESISLNERTTWQDPREIMHPDGKVLPYNSYPLDSDLNLSNNLVPRVSHLPALRSRSRGGKMRNPGNEVAFPTTRASSFVNIVESRFFGPPRKTNMCLQKSGSPRNRDETKAFDRGRGR